MTMLTTSLTQLSAREVLATMGVNRNWKVRIDGSSKLSMTRDQPNGTRVALYLEFVGIHEDELNYVEVWQSSKGVSRRVVSISVPDEGPKCLLTAVAVLGGFM